MHFFSNLGLPASAVAGLPGGVAYALIGVGLVLLYRMGGVVSFTQGSLGVFGAVLFQQRVRAGRPMWLALPAGLLLSGALGGVIGWVMVKWFADKSVLIRSAVTIGVTVSFSSIALRLYGTQSLYFPYLVPFPRQARYLSRSRCRMPAPPAVARAVALVQLVHRLCHAVIHEGSGEAPFDTSEGKCCVHDW